MSIVKINTKQKDKSKFIQSKFFMAEDKAIGFVGDKYTSFNIGDKSFSLFDTDIELLEDTTKIRIKLFDAEGQEKLYTLYDPADKSKTPVRASELVSMLEEDYDQYSIVENDFDKAEALRRKFSR